MNAHVIYTEEGKVKTCEVDADNFADAEAKFQQQHPTATYWEIGLPLVEVSAS